MAGAAGIDSSKTSILPRRVKDASERRRVGGGRISRLVKKDRLPRSICEQENTGIGRVQSVQCEGVCRRALCV